MLNKRCIFEFAYSDEPLPVVSKVGESVNVSCPKGPVTSQRKLEMTAVDAKRIKTVDSHIVVMRDIGKLLLKCKNDMEIFRTFLCS